MTLATSDINRILEALNLSQESIPDVIAAIEAINNIPTLDPPDALATVVEGYLTELEALSEAIGVEFSSASSALIKVDVLEYERGQRAKGMLIQKRDLMAKISRLLGIEPNFAPLFDQFEALGIPLPYPRVLQIPKTLN